MARLARPARIVSWTAAAIVLLYAGLVGMRALWPIDFVDAVQFAAADHEVEPDLVFALVYAESRFDPQAVSPCGAIGLMQIMPSTGLWIAQQLGIPEPPNGGLFDVERNLRFGVWYLRQMLARYEDVETALLAYNAGPAAVDGWLSTGSTPFRETIEYVRRVQGVRSVYRLYMRIPMLLRVVPRIRL